MKLSVVLLALLAVTVALTLAPTAIAETPNAAGLRGLSPALAAHLSSGDSSYVCDHGRTVLPRSRVNDDYCDCKDGSDEPGTGGCAGACGVGAVCGFYCPNAGHVPKTVAGSFVNDGICDCCDGSDEWRSAASCQNGCAALADDSLKGRRARNREVIAGAKAKMQYLAEARALRATLESEIAARSVELDAATAKTEALQREVNSLEPQERIAKARQSRQKAAETAAAEPAAETEQATPPDGPTDDGTVLDDPAEASMAAYPDGAAATPPVEDAPESAEDLAAVPLGTEAEAISAAEDARSDLAEATTAQKGISDDIAAKRAMLSLPDGPDHEYLPIAKKCFSAKTREYEYELCVFDNAEQKPLNGGHGTSLGTWGEWKSGMGTMVYSRGAKCWNGPERSFAVRVVCGDAETLSTVDEPEKCAYTAVLETPAACDATHADVTDLNLVLPGVVY